MTKLARWPMRRRMVDHTVGHAATQPQVQPVCSRVQPCAAVCSRVQSEVQL